MLQDLKDAFTITLARRLSSPIMSTFLLSWCVVNYDVILLAFSSTDWNTKIIFISNAYDVLLYKNKRVMLPIVVSILYITTWPIIDMFFYWTSKKWTIIYKELQLKMENLTPVSNEELREIKREFYQRIELLRQESATKDERISELEAIAKTLHDEALELKKRKVFDDKGATFDKFKSEIAELKKENQALSATNKAQAIELDDLAKEPKPDKPKDSYQFQFYIDEDVRKAESKKGEFFESRQTFTFRREDLPEELFSLIHDIFYDSNLGNIDIKEPLTIMRTDKDGIESNGVLKKAWCLAMSPSRLTAAQVLDIWMSEYQEAEKIIREEHAKRQQRNKMTSELEKALKKNLPVSDRNKSY